MQIRDSQHGAPLRTADDLRALDDSAPANRRYRFAPSPTGSLHVGGARTAILNWLLARGSGGVFVLRVEDTDLERNVGGAEEQMLEDLRWLGLDWDEGPGVGGASGPYRQSERGETYRSAAKTLLASGHAYFCRCPATQQAGTERRPRCRCAASEFQGDWQHGASVRLLAPAVGEVMVPDLVRGDVVFPAESIEDFVLLRSDGRATYNFAAAVDDAAMRISHVIRGVDHLNNTPKQVAVYQALGLRLPLFAHIPLILGPDRQKLSKRHGATSIAEHRRQGYLPEALVNYLSLLSWSSTSGEEFLQREQLLDEVDLDRVGASDAVYDPEKLRWLSHRHLQALTPEDLTMRALPFLGENASGIDSDRLPHALVAVQERVSLLSEIPGELAPFRGPHTQEHREARSALRGDDVAVALLNAAATSLEALTDWEPEPIGLIFREVGTRMGVKGRALFQPLRVALTGEEHGPDLSRIAFVLGVERVATLLRLEEA
jgi:nondiscriminating glutamyl-tRNA synthetase